MTTPRTYVSFAVAAAACFTGAITPSAARAQAGGGIPDLSDFAGAISKSVVRPAPAPPAGTLFKTTLVVPSVSPGTTARGIGRQLRESVEKQSGKPQPALVQMEAGMPKLLTELEGFFVKNGFAKRDMGVAFGYAFVDLYETANKTTVPEAGTKTAVRTFATAVTKTWGAKFTALAPAAKEKMYESILISTTLNTVLADQFGKSGKTEDEASIRQSSGALFEKLIGVPPSQVKISPDGKITGLAAAAPAASTAAP